MEKFGFRCIAYQEKSGSFTGVCLDLDIIEEGHVSLFGAVLSINEAITSHMRAAKKMGFPKELVHRPAPKEYWEKLEKITKAKTPRLPIQNFQFFTSQPDVSNLTYA